MESGKENAEESKPEKMTIFSIFKKIESDIVKWFFGTICTMICLAIPFYFNTTSTMQAHTQEINITKSDMVDLKKTVSTLEKSPAYNSEQISAIKKIVEEIQLRQQRLEVRQDKMYDLMLETLKAK
jgi:hypothetical protein